LTFSSPKRDKQLLQYIDYLCFMKSKYKYDKGGKPKGKGPNKNQKGLDRIEKTVEQLREEYEAKYPFAQDYDAVSTPEGLPTFEEFVLSKDAGRVYNEADPLWQYQKTSQLGPLAFQRWRGAQTSKDGKNYRTPYVVLPDSQSFSPSQIAVARQSGDAGDVVGTAGLTTNLKGYKEGHRKWLEQRSILDKIKGIPGSIAPPANYVTGRGAAIGGRNIPEALNAYWMSKAFGKIPMPGEDKAISVPEVANVIGSFMSMPILGSSDVVVPTAGLKVNPFGKQVRALKKDARRESKQLDKKLAKGEKYYTRELEKEKSRLEDQLDLYEKRYGIRPTVQDNTMNMPNFVRPAVEAKRSQNRNPIFLKQGGKVKLKKKK